jgi:REP element-mobilizing transposase RayT
MKELFLTVIGEAKTSKGFKFKLWNFCIMDNHFHFLITPEKGQSLSDILKWIKMVFAIRWNKKHNKTGHFWGDRFYSREIKDEKDFWTVYNYIDQNPVAAGLMQKPVAYMDREPELHEQGYLTYPASKVCPPRCLSYQRDNADNTVFPMVRAAVLPLLRLLY